jgi:hypothetical protein
VSAGTVDCASEAIDVDAMKNKVTFADDTLVGRNAITEVDSAYDRFVRNESLSVTNEIC